MSHSATLVTAATPEKPKLAFRNSDAALGGFSDVLIHQAKDNADNIVGAGNLTADALWLSGQIAQGIADPAFLAASAINASSRLPLLMSSDEKSTAQELTSSTALSSAAQEHPQGIAHYLKQKTKNALDPVHHPVEASALIAMIAGSVFLALGINTLIGMEGTKELALGSMQLALGVLTMGGRILEVFSQTPAEKAVAENTEHPEKENGALSSMWQWAQDNPEIVSGAIGFASSTMALGIGLASGNLMMSIAGAVWMGTCLMYMGFVRREAEPELDRNSEQAPQDKPIVGSFTAKLNQERHRPSRDGAAPSLA